VSLVVEKQRKRWVEEEAAGTVVAEVKVVQWFKNLATSPHVFIAGAEINVY